MGADSAWTEVAIAVSGGVFTAACGVVAYVFHGIQKQIDDVKADTIKRSETTDKRIDALNRSSVVNTEKLQRLEVADARHEERAEDTVRRLEDLDKTARGQAEETRSQGLLLMKMSTKLDQLLVRSGTTQSSGSNPRG